MCSIVIYLSATFHTKKDALFDLQSHGCSDLSSFTTSPPRAGLTPSFFPKSPRRPPPLLTFFFNIVFSYLMPLRTLNAIISILLSRWGSLPGFTQVPLTCPVFLRSFYLLLSNNSTIMSPVVQAQSHRVLVNYLLSLSNLPLSLLCQVLWEVHITLYH